MHIKKNQVWEKKTNSNHRLQITILEMIKKKK